MGPKAKTKELDDTFWRKRIEEAQLDEETWQVKVIMIECAGGDQDRLYLSKFENFAAEERRFVIKNICRTETIFMINQLGAEKKVKDENLRVFEEGQAFLKEKKDIPCDIMGLIIKHLIMKMKEEYLFIRRQRLEVKEGLRRESLTMIDKSEVRGTVSVKPPESVPISPPKKPKGKGKGEPDSSNVVPEPEEGKKYNTVLRERGEEWRDRVYVDDFPTDGPSLYVAITGFMDPNLAGSLVKLGIPLTAIVQIRIDPTKKEIPSTLTRPTKRGLSQTELMHDKSHKFWEDLQELRINRDSAEDFKNTAFIIFSPPYWESEHLSGEPDKIYDEVCYLMYDVQDLTRQHAHFLDNMDIIHIPEVVKDENCVRLYNQQIDELPSECVTIYSLLDAVLQIASKDNFDDINSRSSLSTAVTLNPAPPTNTEDGRVDKAKSLIRNVFSTLCKTENDKKIYRVTYGEEFETHKDPIVIKYGDFAKNTTFHLGNINLDNIVGSTLFGMPLHKLWVKQDPPGEETEAKINFHVNVLLSCFDRSDIETAELNRLLHILSCRKLFNNRSSLKKCHLESTTITSFKKTYLKRSILAEPLLKCPSLYGNTSITSPSFPSMTKYENDSKELLTEGTEQDAETYRIKFLFDCPDISELVSAAEIANNRPINHMIDDFEFFEDYSGTRAFQILLDAFNKSNCVDYKYCEVTDCLALMFFNSHDKDGISREEWRCHLPTPLCLQDFFDFVLEEHYKWIQDEETLYDQTLMIRRQSECQEIFDPLAPVSCIEDTHVDMDLLMDGSLKHEEYVKAEESVQSASDKLTMTATSSKKSIVSPSITEADSTKSSKKTKSTDPSPRKVRQSFVQATLSDTAETPSKPFQGYDLGDRRVEVFGKDATFFSKDGSCLCSNYTLLIPMNFEFITLSFVPGNSHSQFWVHKALGEFVSPEIHQMCKSFRMNTRNNVIINITKQSYQVPFSSPSAVDALKPKQSTLGSQSAMEILADFELKSHYSFCITWPNGLITESVHETGSSNISHIKQYYLTPTSQLSEDMRCISLNGEVIIFSRDGNIEVLKPDGTYIKITKYEKRVVFPEVHEELSEVSSEKNKKNKGKSKEKSPAKSLKQDEPLEEKPLEYELFIEEFEIIETNGLRQKWVNNDSIDIEKLLIRTATEYCLGEIFSRRLDGTHILLNKDGVQIVTFPNKTRITTHFVVEDDEIFPEWTMEEREYFDMIETGFLEMGTSKSKSKVSMSQKSYQSGSMASDVSRKYEEEKERSDGYISVQIIYTIEHANFTTVTVNKTNDKITIDSPNNSSLIVDFDNNYEFVLDDTTVASFHGENLNISYEACLKCKSYTTCNISIDDNNENGNQSLNPQSETDTEQPLQTHWVKMKDSFCKKVIVDNEGSIEILDEPCSQEVLGSLNAEEITRADETVVNPEESSKLDGKSESSMTSHGKCREIYQAKNVRFIILERDLTCSELIHRAVLEQYEHTCRWQPWCNINQYDTFGDNRMLRTILMPINITESEKWLMESKMADKPKHLSYKDLVKDPGKGFYHWMRPYERYEPKPMKPDNVLTHKLPRAYILRILEQQWKDKDREQLKGGKELLTAILRYRHVLEAESETMLHVPIIDLRLDTECRVDELVQVLGHKIYQNLKYSLEEDVQTRAKATITTKPLPPPEEMSFEGETYEEEMIEAAKLLAEERATTIKELEEVSKMSAELQKYWRRRAEEKKEEEFYLYLLREGSVPQYFSNILGGAIWWEMNRAAGDAVTNAERRKMKCVCAEDEATSSRTADTSVPIP